MFQVERFPERVVVVGAGFIACEFAGILRGLGVHVTQLVRRDHLLHGFDSELSSAVQEGMLDQGIDLRFSTSPVAIEGVPGDPKGAPGIPGAAAAVAPGSGSIPHKPALGSQSVGMPRGSDTAFCSLLIAEPTSRPVELVGPQTHKSSPKT